ncbi:MAG: hypothetical protein IT389_01055 [Nitrospira sp.]|nr:hypothetical protein [Nitrospira sp.]
MTEDTDIQSETSQLTFLNVIVTIFLGLAGIGLVYVGGLGWIIVNGLARTHGGNAGAFGNIVLPAIAIGGVA